MTDRITAILRSLVFVVFALVLCALVFQLAGYNAALMLGAVADGAFLRTGAIEQSLRWALPLDAGRLPGDGRTQPHLYDWLRGLNEADRQVADHTLAQFVALVKSKLAAERFELQNSYDEFDSAKLMHRCDTLDDVIEWGYTALAEAR